MDVIVDTCILFPDPFMRSNNFKDLFQHLRTTDSRLVILPVVFDEVIAKHEKELAKRHQKACDAYGSLNAMTLHPLAPRIDTVNLAQETRALEGVLKSGLRQGEPLPLKVLTDYSTIDVKEIAKRGMKRIPPASPKGEQLRDVMVWLATLSYCEESKKPAAFITNDMGFWNDGQKTIRPELAEELSRKGIDLHVFPNITEFLKSIAAPATDISHAWLMQRVSMTRIEQIVKKYRHTLIYGVWHGSRDVDLLSSKIEFKSGKLYDLGEEARLAEVEFQCQLVLRVSDWGHPLAEESLLGQIPREQMPQQQQILHTEEYRLNASLFISLRLQDETITDLVPERFEYDSPPAGTEVVTPPVFLRQSYP
jgi:hypothetical protein